MIFNFSFSLFSVLILIDSQCHQVLAAGNRFFVYSMDIHIARMAGCFSIVADQMDERSLTVYHAAKLCDELCGIDRMDGNEEIPTFDDAQKYIQCIAARNKRVFDWKWKRMTPLIDIKALERFIKSGGRDIGGWSLEMMTRPVGEWLKAHPITAFMIAIAVIWWFR